MTTRVEVDEIQITTVEKLLAWVLAMFFLVGGLWMYFQPLKLDAPPYRVPAVQLSAQDRAALAEEREAAARSVAARRKVRVRRNALEIRREAYRTALDAGRPTASLGRNYELAAGDFAKAEKEDRLAARKLAAARPAAQEAAKHRSEAYRRAFAARENEQQSRNLKTFFLRLGWVLLCLAAGYWLLGRLRSRRSRYLVVGIAFVGFAAVQALVMAGDYLEDYVDVRDMGPLALSLAGIALTLGAFVALQRYLAKRLPYRRVKKRECPFCGYPVTDNTCCEGCGREVIAACSRCGDRRRVGTRHCRVCGAT